MTVEIRPATAADADAIWGILEPMLRAGETYALPRDWSRAQALDYWLGGEHQAFLARDETGIVGTYSLQPNQRGGGSHVANCGYVTHPDAAGKGVARAMCAHSLALAARQGFRAMQFNFVVSTNVRAIAAWRSFGFEEVGRLPGAFLHPAQGYVDALVLVKALAQQ